MPGSARHLDDRRLVDTPAPAGSSDDGFTRLTAREFEVAAWMAEGKTNREIGLILGISFRTVDRHVGAILRKLGVENRMSAVQLASTLLGH